MKTKPKPPVVLQVDLTQYGWTLKEGDASHGLFISKDKQSGARAAQFDIGTDRRWRPNGMLERCRNDEVSVGVDAWIPNIRSPA
jgi:hypothetical protein